MFRENCLSLQLRMQYDETMVYKVHDILEYIIAVVSDFAKKFSLSEKEAYNYINAHHGVRFIEQNYGIIHTLNFDEAVDGVATYCRRYGGEL